jgi:RNA polymerase sigma factor (sigma-70 family)
VQISTAVAEAVDWSKVQNISKNGDSLAFRFYRKKLSALEDHYFPGNQAGTIYLVVVDRDEAYENYPDQQYPMQDAGRATPWEREAYATGRTTYNDIPYSDPNGTYIGAFTPARSKGKIVGLVAATSDIAPLSDVQGIVRTAFELALVPGLIVALLLAYFLAGNFIEPMELFRRIEAAKELTTVQGHQSEQEPDLFSKLTPREREIAYLTPQGLTIKEIAERISVSPETVKQHLKNIREKTRLKKADLAIQAAARLRTVKQGTG